MLEPATFEQTLSSEQMRGFQLTALNAQLDYARCNSAWYRRTLADITLPLADLEQLAGLPLLTTEQLIEHGPELLAVSASQIERIVTLRSSGSSGPPKRLFFSAADLQATVDFFRVGMGWMCQPGQRVLICQPGNTPGGISRLLEQGLLQLGALPLIHGAITDYDQAAEVVREFSPHTIVGLPQQLLGLARQHADLRPQVVLVSGDAAPPQLRREIESVWGCETFDHYGLTESGYGCAVECPAHQGMHIRHDNLLLEIIDPISCQPLPHGQWGEIVLTTLRRQAQPLLRYRTGDKGRLLDSSCGCGSPLVRLDTVPGRLVHLKKGQALPENSLVDN